MEEADERIFVEAKDASREQNRIMIKSTDSDVAVTANANFHQLVPVTELWIEFGAAKSFRFIPIHQIARGFGPDQSVAFLFFHAFSGCDTTSSLLKKDKFF